MQYLGLTIKNDRFYVDELLEKVSEKRLSDFKLTDIYDAIIDNDHDAIMNGYCKKEYFNSLLYWSAPKIAFLIENGKPYEQYKYKVIESEKKGIIYLIKIGEGLYKFGRTKDIKRRLKTAYILSNDRYPAKINPSAYQKMPKSEGSMMSLCQKLIKINNVSHSASTDKRNSANFL